KGRWVLDAGCGAGRFSSIGAGWGAKVVAVDLAGGAVEACALTLREQSLAGDVVQASIYSLPFRKGYFDYVFSLGVLQHTPDPGLAMRSLPRFVAPGGGIAYWIYERRWYQYLMVRNYLRVVSARLPVTANRYLAMALTFILFPVALAMSYIPYVKRLIPFLPISARIRPETSFKQRWEWTVLDTFDSYSARYEFNQRASDVMAALKEAGIDRIQRRPARGMAITGTKSHRPGN
ncbi:MAG: class I SAM-dependent methyltransferase, partial [Planctomycetes bacterium]|nr:class I SAM-dependent methyltransferase [Planctomycetota bacterium]